MNVIIEGMTRLECYVPILSEILSAHLRKKEVAFETSWLYSVVLCFYTTAKVLLFTSGVSQLDISGLYRFYDTHLQLISVFHRSLL